MKKKHLHTGRTAKSAQRCVLLVLPGIGISMYVSVKIKGNFHKENMMLMPKFTDFCKNGDYYGNSSAG